MPSLWRLCWCCSRAQLLQRCGSSVRQATIKDKENGDKVDVSSLLNSGTRIDDVFTFVVGAVDEDETRTDALMVATMDTKDKTINVMNIPRDTMCNNTATGASKKINAAYGMDTGGKGRQHRADEQGNRASDGLPAG